MWSPLRSLPGPLLLLVTVAGLGSALAGSARQAFKPTQAMPRPSAEAVARSAAPPTVSPSPAYASPIPRDPLTASQPPLVFPIPGSAAAPTSEPPPMLRWVYMVGSQLPDSIRQHPDAIDVLSPQWFHLDADGNIYGSDSPEVTRFAKAHGIRLMPAIVNGEFDADAAHDILVDANNQTRALDSLSTLMGTFGYDGVNIDFENLYVGDRQPFSAFMSNLYARVHSEDGKALTIALPSKTRDNYDGFSGPFDYAALAPDFDLAVVMTYDDHNTVTGPGPVAPLDWDERVISYAAQSIPPNKLLLGLPFYGYDWNVSTGWSRALSYDSIARTVFAFGPGIQMDPASQTPAYTYSAGDGTHQIWFENSTSLAAKLALAAKHGLAGWGAWRAGMEDQSFWSLDLIGAGQPRLTPVSPDVLVPPAPESTTPSSPPAVAPSAAPAPSSQPRPSTPTSIIVAPGETLSAIAARLGTSVDALIVANRLGPDGFIQAGQKIVTATSALAPGQHSTSGAIAAPPRPARAKATITVGVGDTLSAIAARYGASLQALLSANGLRSPDRIQAGQRLTIPAA